MVLAMHYHRSFSDLGISIPPCASGNVRTTCPRCSQSRRKQGQTCLSVNVDSGVFFCHHCGWRGRLNTPGNAYYGNQPNQPQRDGTVKEKAASALALWRSSLPAKGTLVQRYLESRGLMGRIPKAIRFLPQAYHGPTRNRRPCMIAKVARWPSNTLCGVSRTFLKADGSGRFRGEGSRMFLGSVSGGAVRLRRARETLAVTEGIETGLAVLASTGLTTWAALSASGMANLVVPDDLEEFVICADFDEAGIGAAESLARRLIDRVPTVRVAIPDTYGDDWADVIRRRK